MNNEIYYGCENPESVSYLEFGSINLVEGKKDIWAYWQNQTAYDLYMFARYARDLFEFRKYIENTNYSVLEFNKYVLNSAHTKIMDYLFKYAGLLTIKDGGAVCESGSSLYGWIEEALACDYTFFAGKNVKKIKGLHYIGSDIAEMMNEGAKALHSDYKMDFCDKYTLATTIDDICDRITDRLALFYGLSVSIRYAIRNAEDLVKIAKKTDLSIYNRLSLTFDGETKVNIYGTGKTVYIVSLPELVRQLELAGFKAKFCTKNMQREKDGANTVRASIIISKEEEILTQFINNYETCIVKCGDIPNVEAWEWLDIKELE